MRRRRRRLLLLTRLGCDNDDGQVNAATHARSSECDPSAFSRSGAFARSVLARARVCWCMLEHTNKHYTVFAHTQRFGSKAAPHVPAVYAECTRLALESQPVRCCCCCRCRRRPRARHMRQNTIAYLCATYSAVVGEFVERRRSAAVPAVPLRECVRTCVMCCGGGGVGVGAGAGDADDGD